MPYQTFHGSLDASGLRVTLIVSRFNEFITEQLAKGTCAAGVQAGEHSHCESAGSVGITDRSEAYGARL